MKIFEPKYIIASIWIIIILSSLQHHLAPGNLNVITWDVYGYYLYLPAIFKYGDTMQYLFALDHLKAYHFSSDLYQVMDWNEYKAPIYTLGMAIIYLPFYLIADIIALITPGIVADGLSPIYQWAIIVASWIYTLVGLIFTVRLLKLIKFSGIVISWSLITIYLGTNLFHYAAFENGMPHIYLYTLYAALIYFTVSWHKDNRISYLIWAGIIIALLCLIRPSEVIALIIPLTYGVYNRLTFLVKVNRIIINWKQILVMLMVGLTLVMVQVIYWKVNINEWIFNGYQGHHFDFLQPHIIDGLFSFRKGWLLYSPLCVIGLLGIPLLWKKDKRFFAPVVGFLVVNLYIVLSWHIWWYASSFGMRALVQSYAVLAIPLAAGIERLSKNRWTWMVGTGIIVLLSGLNLFQDWQYRNKILLQDEMNKTFYKKSFLKTNENRQLRKFIDNEEEYLGYEKPILIAEYNHSNDDDVTKWDTIFPGKFSHTHRLPLSQFKEEDEAWLKIDAHTMMMTNRFNNHDQARLVAAIKNKDENLKWKGVRFQSFSEVEKWENIYYDFKTDTYKNNNDYLEVTIWNNGPDTLLLKSLNVFQYK